MIKKIRILPCVTTIIIMCLIFFFSSQNADSSSEVSDAFTLYLIKLAEILHILSSSNEVMSIGVFHKFVRKLAHFTIYASLGMSVWCSLVLNWTQLKKRKLFIISIIFCGCYAASDEFHQLFSQGRGAKVTDVLIDTFGAFVGIWVAICFCKMIKNLSNRKGFK